MSEKVMGGQKLKEGRCDKKSKEIWDSPGGPVVKTPRFQHRGAEAPSLDREPDPTRCNQKFTDHS